MTEPYRPSNGTEGAGFIAEWCCSCERDINEDCPILAATFRYEVDDPNYPHEWINDERGPRCTAWCELGKPIPPEPDTLSGDLFEAAP